MALKTQEDQIVKGIIHGEAQQTTDKKIRLSEALNMASEEYPWVDRGPEQASSSYRVASRTKCVSVSCVGYSYDNTAVMGLLGYLLYSIYLLSDVLLSRVCYNPTIIHWQEYAQSADGLRHQYIRMPAMPVLQTAPVRTWTPPRPAQHAYPRMETLGWRH